MMAESESIRADVIVVGGGVAGLSAALRAEGRKVVLVTKSEYGEGGSSPYAQGGIAVAVGPDDTPEIHSGDTIEAGAGLCDERVVRAITAEGPRRFRELQAIGAEFDIRANGGLALGREGAHRRRRVAHASGDATGAELVRALAEAVAAASHVEILENHFVCDLLSDHGRVVGISALSQSGRSLVIHAAAVVLATGGIGQVFEHTTNPREATGDGVSLAAGVGAKLSGLEFVQFHPTALDAGGDPLALISEAVRGEGAVLVDEHGNRFMVGEHAMAELAPRDIVARAIMRLRRDGGRTFLDARSLGGDFERRFPTVSSLCRDNGIDPIAEPLPVVPAAHYHMGGIMTDLDGRSSVPGLWACGEVSFTGLHGANRLASNSLLEALVIGSRCGEALAATPALAAAPADTRTTVPEASPWIGEDSKSRGTALQIRRIIASGAGVERSAAGIEKARTELKDLTIELGGAVGELRSLLQVGALVLTAAAARTESRGGHYRSDFPWPSHCWKQNLVFDGFQLRPPQPISAVAMG